MKNRLFIPLMGFALTIGVVGCSANDKEATDKNVDTSEETSQDNATTEESDQEDVVTEETEDEEEEVDAQTNATVDAATSASTLQDDIIQSYEPKDFTDSDAKKALFIVGDPRKYSVQYDLVYTAMEHFEENNVEVELSDLYDIEFDPVLSEDDFYYAKDGYGEPIPEIKTEQEFVTQADYIVFCYPNWHDTPTSIVKGYMEKVFAKQFAYKDTDQGLEGMLEVKSIQSI